jgi:MFS family permease
LSVLVGVLYAVLLPMFPRRAGLWSGLVTPIVWSGLVFATLDVVNPTLNGLIDWKWFVASQLAFGLTCGFVVARTERIATMQSWSWARRAGLDASEEER